MYKILSLKKWSASIFALILIMAISGCTGSSSKIKNDADLSMLSNKNNSTRGIFKIVGYMPDYKIVNLDKIQFNKLTHINYAFLIPNSDGTVKPLERAEQLKNLIKKAHQNGVKVQIAVGGWQYKGQELDPVFENLAKTEAGRNKLVDSIINIVNQYGLDGADMDWEHPDPVEGGNGSGKYYAMIMKSLSDKLHAKGKTLSAAILPGVTAEGQEQYWAKGILDEVLKCTDYFNVMVYDGGDGASHSPYSLAEGSLKYWINKRKMSKEKFILGVPFYGRPQWKEYQEIVAMDPKAPTKDVVNGIYYNGIPTIKAKTKLAKKDAGGIMIWEITQDTTDATSLLNAIYQEAKDITPDNDPHIDSIPTVKIGAEITINGVNFKNDSKVKIKGNGKDEYMQLKSITETVIIAKNNYAKGSYMVIVQSGGKTSNDVTLKITDGNSPDYPVWDKSKAYVGGDKVSWKENNWQAKWWTQGEEPGTTGVDGVWKKI